VSGLCPCYKTISDHCAILRWFPKCPYIYLVKGANYIKGVLQRSTEGGSQQSGNQSMPPAPTISIDDAMNTQAALDALSMGLNAGRVRAVMQRKIALTGRPFNSTEALVSAVLDGQIEDEGFESPEANQQLESQVTQLLLSAVSSVAVSDDNEQAPGTSNNTPSTSSAVPETLASIDVESKLPADESERRMKNVECKICMAEEVGVVFLPCGHLLTCVMCAPALSTCPLCRQPIRGKRNQSRSSANILILFVSPPTPPFRSSENVFVIKVAMTHPKNTINLI
jgi:baculoviral IAP repeat-containing protein 2/3